MVLQCRSPYIAAAFHTAAFRPPHSLGLAALKLYFAQHPHEHQQHIIDTKYDEIQRVNQAAPTVGLTSADGQLSFGQVTVTPEEGANILQQLLGALITLSGRYTSSYGAEQDHVRHHPKPRFAVLQKTVCQIFIKSWEQHCPVQYQRHALTVTATVKACLCIWHPDVCMLV